MIETVFAVIQIVWRHKAHTTHKQKRNSIHWFQSTKIEAKVISIHTMTLAIFRTTAIGRVPFLYFIVSVAATVGRKSRPMCQWSIRAPRASVWCWATAHEMFAARHWKRIIVECCLRLGLWLFRCYSLSRRAVEWDLWWWWVIVMTTTQHRRCRFRKIENSLALDFQLLQCTAGYFEIGHVSVAATAALVSLSCNL